MEVKAFTTQHFFGGILMETLEYNPRTIWSARQDNPELIVQDLKKGFDLNEEQCEIVRKILLYRGVNKWFYARRLFIKLKHEVKEMLRADPRNKTLQYINEKMQNIAKLPRWVEFPHTTTHNWRNIEKQIVIKGKHC